ncbi:dipeptide ABC transporter ATP-binding protein [Corynebacterium pacaense]|uniref:dipeptide ABC transporter ATP-binding protein n=1 Tax=Corynebacterium pacaense TaxID=1816684 RepID=UPI001C4E016F|nr:ABC transporter ATP-binding protein [Corynebacterium pacaense]
MTAPLLSVSDLRLSYRTHGGLVDAVRGVSFTVDRGERLALVGESGSGKSTIASTIVGLAPENLAIGGGNIRFGGDGVELLGAKPRLLNSYRGRHIGFVPQDPSVSLNPVHRIGDQVAEVLRLHGVAGRKEARERAVEALAAAGIDRPELRARQYPHELSGGMRQRVLIAIGVVAGPSLLIADEPTSALDVTVQHRILNNLDELTRDNNLSTLFITHDLGVAAERSDRILVLHRGRIVEEGAPDEIIESPQHPYTRQLISDAPSLHASRRVDAGPRSRPSPVPSGASASGAPALELRGISKRFALPRSAGRRGEVVNALNDVSLSIDRGSTYGLVGESGSGKTTLGRIALRLEEPSSGQVLIDGEDVTTVRGGALRELRRRIQVVQQNPYASLNPRMSVAANIHEPLSAFHEGTRSSRHSRAHELLDQVALPSYVAERTPAGLSGGQRQRVAIARALALNPEVLILDEPVSALDVTVQAQILDLLVELQRERGLAYLFISHDLAVVRDIAHTVGVIRRGDLVEEADAVRVFEAPQNPYTRQLLQAIPKLPSPSTAI